MQLALSFDPIAPRHPTVLSYGGGLDSFSMLVWAIANNIRIDLVVFADVADWSPERDGQDPGEWPATYRHIRDVAIPLCERHGIEFKWLTTAEAPIRGERSLFRYFETMRLMPGRMSRLCTAAAKVERVAEYVERRYPEGQIEVWIGFEAGEEKRAENDPHGKAKGSACRRVNRFPLIEQSMCRCRCERLVREAGHPIPRKSACVYCPFSKRGDFQNLASELPETFTRVVELERNCRDTKRGERVTFGTRSVKGKAVNVSLDVWVTHMPGTRPYKRQVKGCTICGAATAATKETKCSYLSDDEAVGPERATRCA
jgi:hypothetical protein